MTRISLFLSVGAACVALPVHAQTAAAQKEEVVCQLLDTCDEPTVAETPRGAPRTGSTRGFSLARPTGDGASAPKPAHTAAPAARKKNPAGAGRYDLRVTFRSGSAELAPSARTRGALFASALKDPRLASRRLRIEGHTDSVGDAARNRDLSERRARAVSEMLTAAGVEADRLDVAGFGSSQPLPGIPTTDGAQRRVVAVLAK